MVVPTSSATVAIATFITELSSVMRNCPAASVISTVEAACATPAPVLLLIAASKALSTSAANWTRRGRCSPHPAQVRRLESHGVGVIGTRRIALPGTGRAVLQPHIELNLAAASPRPHSGRRAHTLAPSPRHGLRDGRAGGPARRSSGWAGRAEAKSR